MCIILIVLLQFIQNCESKYTVSCFCILFLCCQVIESENLLMSSFALLSLTLDFLVHTHSILFSTKLSKINQPTEAASVKDP